MTPAELDRLPPALNPAPPGAFHQPHRDHHARWGQVSRFSESIHMKTIHDASNPDPRPGPYFVSAIDGAKTYIMAGPYATHAEALAKVDPAREIAYEKSADGRSWFMRWGTCRIEGCTRVGSLNKLGLI